MCFISRKTVALILILSSEMVRAEGSFAFVKADITKIVSSRPSSRTRRRPPRPSNGSCEKWTRATTTYPITGSNILTTSIRRSNRARSRPSRVLTGCCAPTRFRMLKCLRCFLIRQQTGFESGKFPASIKLGRLALWKVDDIRNWIAKTH